MSDLASTSNVQVAYAKEAAFGVIPNTGNHRKLRITGETLDYTVTKAQSEEINSSRAVSSVAPTGATTTGGLQGEMSYAEYDDFIEAVLQSSFTVMGTNGVTAAMTVDFTGTTLTASVAPTGNNALTRLQKGQWFKLGGPAPNGGKFYRVSRTVAPTATVLTVDPATPFQAASAVAGVTISSSRATNGAVQPSFTIERQSLDTDVYMAYTGQTVSKMSLNIASGSFTTVSFDMMGKKLELAEGVGATKLPGTAGESFAFDIHSGVSSADCQVWMGGAPLQDTFIKSLSLEYDNSLRPQDAICTLGSVGIASGQIVSQITAQIYFANKAIYQDFIDNKYTEFSFSSLDSSGNGYFFTLPRANASSVKTNASAKDQDMMLDMTFLCVRDLGNADPALRQVIFVDRVGAAVAAP